MDSFAHLTIARLPARASAAYWLAGWPPQGALRAEFSDLEAFVEELQEMVTKAEEAEKLTEEQLNIQVCGCGCGFGCVGVGVGVWVAQFNHFMRACPCVQIASSL